MLTFIRQWRQKTHSYKKQNGQKTDRLLLKLQLWKDNVTKISTNGSKNSTRGTQSYIYIILVTQLNKFPRVCKQSKARVKFVEPRCLGRRWKYAVISRYCLSLLMCTLHARLNGNQTEDDRIARQASETPRSRQQHVERITGVRVNFLGGWAIFTRKKFDSAQKWSYNHAIIHFCRAPKWPYFCRGEQPTGTVYIRHHSKQCFIQNCGGWLTPPNN